MSIILLSSKRFFFTYFDASKSKFKRVGFQSFNFVYYWSRNDTSNIMGLKGIGTMIIVIIYLHITRESISLNLLSFDNYKKLSK